MYIYVSLYLLDAFWIYFLSDLVTTSLFLRQSTVYRRFFESLLSDLRGIAFSVSYWVNQSLAAYLMVYKDVIT